MKPKLIYLTHRVPYPPDKGDRIRNYHILRWLSMRAAVSLACLADEPVSLEQRSELENLCERVAIIPLGQCGRWVRAALSVARGRTATEGAFASSSLAATLDKWSSRTRYSSALVSASSMVPYLQRPSLRDIPAVIDLVDVDSEKWLEYAVGSKWPRSALYRLEGGRLRKLELSLVPWARAITLVSPAEATLFRARGASGPVHAIVNGVDLDHFRPGPTSADESGCVFVGALDYRPNVEGLAWFSSMVWPEVLRRRPGTTLRVVGRRPTPAIERLAETPGIELVANVPDTRPYVTHASVAIAPLLLARGVQNKVLEALAMGKPTVISPGAGTGLNLVPGIHTVVASSPTEWVESIVNLLDNPALRRQLGAEGRRFVEEHHCWDQCLEPLGPLLGLETETPGDLPAVSARSIGQTQQVTEMTQR